MKTEQVHNYMVQYKYWGDVYIDFIQALSPDQAATFVRGDAGDTEILAVAEVKENWRRFGNEI